MSNQMIGRRSFLTQAGVAALTASSARHLIEERSAQDLVPNSAGTEKPKLKAPPLASDCHHHIYDTARFAPVQSGAIPNARVAEYRVLQRRIGTTRNVVVTPRPYGTDNRVTLDAIAQLGANARGVAVIQPNVTDAQLKMLDAGGIRGIRFSLAANLTTAAITTIDMVEPLSKRVNAMGWHIQMNMDADQIVAAGNLWNRIPSTIVFDHMGQLPLADGVKHPAFTIIRRLIDRGRTWIKLSVGASAATELNAKDHPRSYTDVNKIGRVYVQAAPERMVWGSNWPHPNETKTPDDAVLFDLLAEWAPDEATRRRILVENAEKLYGFTKS